MVDAVGHLQTAALSLVAAARAAVDAAERFVRDPGPIIDLLAASARSGWEPPDEPSSDPAAHPSRVERIPVRPPAGTGEGDHHGDGRDGPRADP